MFENMKMSETINMEKYVLTKNRVFNRLEVPGDLLFTFGRLAAFDPKVGFYATCHP